LVKFALIWARERILYNANCERFNISYIVMVKKNVINPIIVSVVIWVFANNVSIPRIPDSMNNVARNNFRPNLDGTEFFMVNE